MKQRNIGIVLSYTNTFLSMVSGLVISVFLLRELGDVNYGVYQAIAAFVTCLVLLEFGTGTVMTRNLVTCLAKGRDEEQLHKNISTIWGIACFLAAIIFIVSIGFYFSIDHIYAKSMTALQIAEAKKIFIFMSIFLIASFATQTIGGMPLAFENYLFAAKLSIFRNTFRIILVIAVVLCVKRAVAVAIVDCCLSIGIFIFTYLYCRRKFKVKINLNDFDKNVFKIALPLCFALFLQIVVTQANSTVGKFVISVMLTPDKVALYSIGLYIFGMYSSIATIPVSMYMPQIGKDVIAGVEGLNLTKSLIQPSRLIVIISGSVVFGFIAVGQQFIEILYGSKFIQAWPIAMILMIPMFINMSNAVVINVLDIKNKRHIRSIIMMISTVINVILTVIWIKKYGVIGAACSTGLSTIIMLVLTNLYYSKAIGIRVLFLYFQAYKGILIYQICGALIGFGVGFVIKNQYISFFAGGFAYILVSFGGFIFKGMNPIEKDFLRHLILRIRELPFVKKIYCRG